MLNLKIGDKFTCTSGGVWEVTHLTEGLSINAVEIDPEEGEYTTLTLCLRSNTGTWFNHKTKDFEKTNFYEREVKTLEAPKKWWYVWETKQGNFMPVSLPKPTILKTVGCENIFGEILSAVVYDTHWHGCEEGRDDRKKS